MEPPDPDVPAGRQPAPLTVPPSFDRAQFVALARPAALVGALALAITSRGDALLLAVLLGIGAGRLASGVAVALAVTAAAVRFGSTDLDVLAGAQAVLGPAGLIGTTAAAASSWLAGATCLLGAARPAPGRISALAALPFGAAAAVLAFGPGPGGDVWMRAVGSVVGTALAAVVIWTRGRRRLDRFTDVLGLAAAAGAVGLAVGAA